MTIINKSFLNLVVHGSYMPTDDASIDSLAFNRGVFAAKAGDPLFESEGHSYMIGYLIGAFQLLHAEKEDILKDLASAEDELDGLFEGL